MTVALSEPLTDPLFGPRGRGAGPAVLRAHLSAATQRIALVLDGVTASTTMVDAIFSVEDELDTSMFRANNVSRDGERWRRLRVPPLGRAVTTRICDGRTPAWPPHRRGGDARRAAGADR